MKLIRKIVLLTVVLALLDWIYVNTLFTPFLEEHAEQYLQVMKIKDCDLIYVSASSNFPPKHIPEKEPKKISQFLAKELGDVHVEAINKPASHAGVYRQLLNIFPEDAQAKVFVVTMNLRSFGPSWIHSELETPLNKANLFYNHRPALLNRFLVSLNAYDDRSAQERMDVVLHEWNTKQLPFDAPQNTVSSWCAVEKWGDWRDPKRQLADQFIKQYGFVIDASNPRVQDFDAIVQWAEERGNVLVLNILAENMQRASELVGSDLTDLMRMNCDFLFDRYQQQGVIVVNNLDVLADSNFTDRDFPTEHYDETGRRTIAKRLAEKVSSIKALNHDH